MRPTAYSLGRTPRGSKQSITEGGGPRRRSQRQSWTSTGAQYNGPYTAYSLYFGILGHYTVLYYTLLCYALLGSWAIILGSFAGPGWPRVAYSITFGRIWTLRDTHTLRVQSTKTLGIYGFYTRNRNSGFGNILCIWVVVPSGTRTRTTLTTRSHPDLCEGP